MINRRAEPRFDRRNARSRPTGRVLPQQSADLPSDFPRRLHRLKEASGLTWNAFSQAIGVDRKQVRRWRKKGVEPSGGAYHSLVCFAAMIPGGLEILFDGGFQMLLWAEEPQG